MTTFNEDIHTYLLYSKIGHDIDISNCFWSEVIAKKNRRKCRFRRLLLKLLENGLSEHHGILILIFILISLANVPAMTPLDASGRLQNSIK